MASGEEKKSKANASGEGKKSKANASGGECLFPIVVWLVWPHVICVSTYLFMCSHSWLFLTYLIVFVRLFVHVSTSGAT
jgi:hypothetical protein